MGVNFFFLIAFSFPFFVILFFSIVFSITFNKRVIIESILANQRRLLAERMSVSRATGSVRERSAASIEYSYAS